MSSPVYNNFRRLLEKWPIDRTKLGRDLGEYIRVAVEPLFRRPNADNSLNESISSSIQKISSNYYNNTYLVSKKASSSGLSETECQQLVSNEFLKQLEEENKKLFSKTEQFVFQTAVKFRKKGVLSLSNQQNVRPCLSSFMNAGYVMYKLFARSLHLHRYSYSKVNAAIDSRESSQPHIPVMAKEVLELSMPQSGKTILDMTFGSGGHTKNFLEYDDSIRVFGLDRDPVAFQMGLQLSDQYPGRFIPLLGRFSELSHLLQLHNVTEVDGVIFDLGCSSMQFDSAERGFSVIQDGPLDMRMDGGRFPNQATAADVIEHIEEQHLARMLKIYGDEKQAKKIARAIIEARYMFKSLKTTSELASLVSYVLNNETRLDKLGRPTHLATKTFQAIRIFVNNEMNELHQGMQLAYDYLKPEGRLITLTFHSLEDRVVKRNLVGIDMDEAVSKSMSQKYRNAASWHNQKEVDQITTKKWQLVNKHVLVPSLEEIHRNPRSRSAKLRCAIKVDL